MARKKIEIYDTSLRDGTQGDGVNFSLADKLEITRELDRFGLDFLEGGWPGSNPKDNEYFEKVRALDLQNIQVVAFGSTHRAGASPQEDPFLQELIASQADVICIFGKSWDLHVEQALRIALEKNIEMIRDSVVHLAERTKKPVFYDAEHFFDGYKSDSAYALDTLHAAVAGGAERIILCDTNGGVLPNELAEVIKHVRRDIPKVPLGIHVHNDGGLAVANTLRAIEEGVTQVHGTINGIGERCGNVDLTAIISNLELKMGYQCVPDGNLAGLTNLSRKIWEFLGRDGPVNQPFVGPSAFAHKGGVHVSAVQRNPETYEHVDPEMLGNARKILISELAGGSNLKAKLANRYPEVESNGAARSILNEVQDKEHAGYSYENADGSFDLLVRKHIGRYQQVFEPIYFRIYSPSNDERLDVDGTIEASVKIKLDEKVELCAAEGNGPVDALNRALEKSLAGKYPVLSDLHLTDFSVRVINSTEETAAKVRVFLQHSFQGELFGTVGVNVDIIKASWNALVEAYHYTLLSHIDFVRELPADTNEK